MTDPLAGRGARIDEDLGWITELGNQLRGTKEFREIPIVEERDKLNTKVIPDNTNS